MQKSNSKIILVCSILVIIAMGVGIFIGYLIGKSSDKGNSNSSQTENTANINSSTPTETIPETESKLQGETPSTEATQSTQEADDTFVLSVGDRKIYLEEINYHLYQLRDYYVEEYGEEPWEVVMEDGRTVKEYAKEQLLSELIETQILVDKAGDYDIELTEEEIAQFGTEAQAYIDKIGPDIMEVFGITSEAVEKVYTDNEIKNRVKNAIIDEITTELSEDSANADLSDADLELKAEEEYQIRLTKWKDSYTIVIGEQWDNIVIGSAG